MRMFRRFSFVIVALVGFGTGARAQDASNLVATPAVTPTAPAVTAQTPAMAGPRLDAVRAGAPAVAATESRSLDPAPMRKADSQRSRTLMIIGGAALLGGAIIGDDVGTIIMLGGLGVGLYGLYLYLQ